jgi:serine/threonine protein phosphatase PrpC
MTGAAESRPRWRGDFQPFVVGEPGRAAEQMVSRPDPRFPERPDMVADGATFADASDARSLHVRAASIRGLSHRYYGKPRQDEYCVRVTDDARWLVLAVADGVASGSHSHLAAEVVTRSGSLRLANALASTEPGDIDWAGLLRSLAEEVVQCGRAALGSQDEDSNDSENDSENDIAEHLAATALFAVVALAPNEDGRRAVHSMALGDTSAWLLPGGSTPAWQPLGRVKNEGAEISSSATLAVPLVPDQLEAPVTVTLGPDDVLVLVTDGIGDPLGSGRGEVGVFLASVWATPPSPLEFAAHVDFARKSYDDDRTAVAVWPAVRSP